MSVWIQLITVVQIIRTRFCSIHQLFSTTLVPNNEEVRHSDSKKYMNLIVNQENIPYSFFEPENIPYSKSCIEWLEKYV